MAGMHDRRVYRRVYLLSVTGAAAGALTQHAALPGMSLPCCCSMLPAECGGACWVPRSCRPRLASRPQPDKWRRVVR